MRARARERVHVAQRVLQRRDELVRSGLRDAPGVSAEEEGEVGGRLPHEQRLLQVLRVTRDDVAADVKGYQYKIEGYGDSPTHPAPKDLPREVLGEGIVLNVTKNAATVLVTYNNLPLYAGDFVEIE